MLSKERAMNRRYLAAAIVSLSMSTAHAQDTTALRAQGQALLAKNCARCHAIGHSGESLHRQAPPFRTLARRYPLEALEEGLAEGFSSGHPDMPEFVFLPEQISAIIAYLRSIQAP